MNKTDTTVLITVFNEEEFIGKTIKSILNQTYRNFELWVIDDGSTDGTYEVIKSFKDSRIKVFRFNENCGMTKRLNWAIPQIKTEFIARMDSHNTSFPERLLKQHVYMKKFPRLMALGSNYSRVDEKSGRTILETNFPTRYHEIKRCLLGRNVFKHASMFIRREVYDLVGLYDPYFKVAQDYDFILRVAGRYWVENLPHLLVREIYRASNMTQKFRVRSAWEAFAAQLNALFKYSYPLWQAIYLVRGVGFIIKSLAGVLVVRVFFTK